MVDVRITPRWSEPEPDLEAAHKASFANRPAVLKSAKCGCFSCLAVFESGKVEDWVEDQPEPTALCPECGIDNVLPSASGLDLNPDFLRRMHAYWF